MPDTFCSHCDTLITDRSSVVVRGELTFCCNNCATAYARAQGAPNESPVGSGSAPTQAPQSR
jgi:hypothetical protein